MLSSLTQQHLLFFPSFPWASPLHELFLNMVEFVSRIHSIHLTKNPELPACTRQCHDLRFTMSHSFWGWCCSLLALKGVTRGSPLGTKDGVEGADLQGRESAGQTGFWVSPSPPPELQHLFIPIVRKEFWLKKKKKFLGTHSEHALTSNRSPSQFSFFKILS